MNSFVELSSEEENCIEIARYLNNLKNKNKEIKEESFIEKSSKLIKEKNYLEFLINFLEESHLLFSEGTERGLFMKNSLIL